MQTEEQKQITEPDVIDLYSYFQILCKRKFLIIAICFIAVVATAIISYILPPVYRITASVSPGWIDTDQQGKAIYVDTAENIKSLIRE